ncbi:MAG: maleylpyruvate isomerase family mycothiol-dependent enzyme [Actinomycetota bacterium]
MSPTLEAPGRTPRKPALDRNTAKRLMTTEYQRVLDQLGSLSREQWRADTCNLGWDVRELAAHMLGMVAMASSLREQMRQTRAAKKRGGEFIDALTAVQVDAYDGWSPEQIVAEYERLAPKAVRFRTRMPGLMRTRPMPSPQPINPPQEYETWTFGYLVDVILTRDQWMHRTDIAAATGHEMTLTREHDGAIVDDVAHEWAQRHGRPVRLALTGTLERLQVFGPTAHASPDDHPSYTLDAVEFCRMLSGRGSGHGLLQTRVPF